MEDPLALAFERYRRDGNEPAMLAAVEQYGGVAPEPSLDCPVAHRIGDLELGGRNYRVVRVYDVDDDRSALFVYPTLTPSAQPGVPYELQGEALRRWVLDELDEESEGPVDWSQYLDRLQE